MPDLEERLTLSLRRVLGPKPLRCMVGRLRAEAFLCKGMDGRCYGFSGGGHDHFKFTIGLFGDGARFCGVADKTNRLAVFQITGVDEVGKIEFIFLFGH